MSEDQKPLSFEDLEDCHEGDTSKEEKADLHVLIETIMAEPSHFGVLIVYRPGAPMYLKTDKDFSSGSVELRTIQQGDINVSRALGQLWKTLAGFIAENMKAGVLDPEQLALGVGSKTFDPTKPISAPSVPLKIIRPDD